MSTEGRKGDAPDSPDDDERREYASPVCYAHEFEAAWVERAAAVPTGVHRWIVEQAAEAIVFADRAGTIRLWNRAAERLFGHTAAEALAMGLVNTVVPHEELDAEVARWCAEIMERSPTAIAIAKRSFNADTESIRGIGGMGMQALSMYYASEESKEGTATVRRLTLHGGGSIVERLESKDDKKRTYTYSILEGPLPVAGYKATLKVEENKDGKSCTVEWSSAFEPAGAAEPDAVKVIRGIYEAGFDNLRKMFGQ